MNSVGYKKLSGFYCKKKLFLNDFPVVTEIPRYFLDGNRSPILLLLCPTVRHIHIHIFQQLFTKYTFTSLRFTKRYFQNADMLNKNSNINTSLNDRYRNKKKSFWNLCLTIPPTETAPSKHFTFLSWKGN